MASNIDPIVLNGLNYSIWAPNMETLLKRKGLWQYMKAVIPYPKDDQLKFVVDGKKDDVVGFITTYTSKEIFFHTSRIDCPHEVWKKLKSLFNKFNESKLCNWRNS